VSRRRLSGLICALSVLAMPATARALLDCPLRDAAYSIDAPLIDTLLSEPAKAVLDRHIAGGVAKIDPFLTRTQAPSFASILTVRQLAGFGGTGPKTDLTKLDAELRALPVTLADRRARCERYDNDRPAFTLPRDSLRVLLFEKMTGFRDTPSVTAAQAAFKAMAVRHGWTLVTTDKGGAMHPSVLGKFDVVIWNNVSGDVLTLRQRKAFRRYIEAGGAFVGVHGSAGDPVYFWNWYADTLIGARFIGHPSEPQFQDARIAVEVNATGIGHGLPAAWTMNDEWYSFASSPRLSGATVIATLDEGSYAPGQNRFGGAMLAMGRDHPIAWTRCIGRGRSFYSAIGHRPETYADAAHVRLLEQAISWAAGAGICAGSVQ
jgi:type 1 glutamine amidotransferase